MPYLDDDWREPDGTRVMDPDTGTWYTHETYFTEVLLADPVNETDGIYSGNIVLNVYDKRGRLFTGTPPPASTSRVLRR